MSGLPQVPFSIRACPFCGLATDVNHETQEGCIAALHAEIGRMRDILASSRPTGAPAVQRVDDGTPRAVRLALD
jgi:hypothetical protein